MYQRGMTGVVWFCVVAVALPILSGCAGARQAGLVCPDLPDIDVSDDAIEILSASGDLDSPVLSPDGQRLAVQIEVYSDPVLPYEIYSLAVAGRTESGQFSELKTLQEGIYRKYAGRVVMGIQPSFDETGDRLVVTQVRFDSLLSIPSPLSIRSWVERIPWQGGTAQRLLECRDWGLEPNELLQHARVSPDGRWLTFYTRIHEKTQGVYLLNLQTGERHRLSTEHDKHPTWSPDGRRIYFHHVFSGPRHRFDFLAAGPEQSVLGYYDLTIEDGRLVGQRRCLMDETGEGYIYQKHPDEVPGTGLLFFHGQTSPDGKKKLMVRRAEAGSQAFVVKMTYKGDKLKAAKHPCSSFRTKDLMFVAKAKGDDNYGLLLGLTEDAMNQIGQALGGK